LPSILAAIRPAPTLANRFLACAGACPRTSSPLELKAGQQSSLTHRHHSAHDGLMASSGEQKRDSCLKALLATVRW
jgi:hypothetical protein